MNKRRVGKIMKVAPAAAPKSLEIVLPAIIDLNDDPSTILPLRSGCSSGPARDETQISPFDKLRAGWGEWNKGEKRPLLYVEEIQQ